MKAVPFAEVPAAAWDQACLDSSGAWLFHSSSWIEIESRYFSNRNQSVALFDGSGIVAVQPLYLAEVGIGWRERLLHSGLHRHTGLAMVDGLSAPQRRAAHAATMDEISSLAEREGVDRIQLNAQNLAPLNLSVDRAEIPHWVSEYGFHLGLQFGPAGIAPAPGMSTCCADLIVDLGPPEEDLFAALDASARRAIRKAIGAGLDFEPGRDATAVDNYYELATLSAARTGETPAPREYFEAIWHTFSGAGRCAILFVRHNGRRVAALLLAIDKGAASFLGGVSNPDYLPMRVNDFLHWSGIGWARAAGLKHYRLGPHFPEVPREWPIARVSRFKTKFGGRPVTVIQGSRFLHPEKYLAGATERLSELCSRRAETPPTPE